MRQKGTDQCLSARNVLTWEKSQRKKKMQQRGQKVEPDKLFGFLAGTKKPPLEFAGALFTKVGDLAMSIWTVGALPL